MPITSEARVHVESLQQWTPADAQATNDLAHATLDNVVASFLTGGLGYTGMTVALDGASTSRVVVAPGRLYTGAGGGYALRDAFTVDLGSAIAAIPADKSALVAILAAASEADLAEETRTFLDASKKPTNPRDPWPTISPATRTRTVRSAIISRAVGTADVQPDMPAYGGSLCLLATVTINNVGVVGIQQNAAQRITSLETVARDAATLAAWRAALDPKVVGLLSTVSALATQAGILFPAIFDELGRINDRLNALEQRTTAGAAAVLKGADYFIDASQSAPDAPGYAARIDQGLRFPTGATKDFAIEPANLYQAGLRVVGDLICPAYTETVSVASPALDPGVASAKATFNEYAPVNGTMVRRGLGATRVRWSPYLVAQGAGQLLLNANPEDLFSIGGIGDLVIDQGYGDWRAANPELSRGPGYWRDLTGRGFWIPVESTEAVAGIPALAQAISGAGAEMWTSLDVGMIKLGDAPMRVVIADDRNGNPDFSRIYADVTLVPTGGFNARTRVPLPFPIPRSAGGTLHVLVYTSGQHQILALGQSNPSGVQPRLGGAVRAFAGGQWVVVPGLLELAIGVNRASFSGSGGVLRVPCKSVTLAGGIDTIDIVNPGIIPPGCEVAYETQIGGAAVPLAEAKGPHPLDGRPSELPLTMVLRFTEAAAPLLAYSEVLGEGGYGRVSRSATALKHVSATRTPPVPVTKVVQIETIDQWDASKQTLTARLLTGAGFGVEGTPSAVSDEALPGGGLRRKWTWLLGAAVTDHRMAVMGSTSDPTKPFVGRQADWSAEA